MDKSIYIILVNYNGIEDTVDCIESIKNTSYTNYSIIVVDNASTKGDLCLIGQRWDDIIIIKNKVNEGFAKANNAGIKYALEHNADLIILLNNDTIVKPDFLPKIIETFSKYDIEVLTCAIKYYSDKDKYWYAGGEFKWSKGYGVHHTDEKLKNDINEINFMTGCCIIAKRDVFKQLVLPEDYFMYFEDVDFCLELNERNIPMYYTPNIEIYHKVSASVGVESPFFVYYWNRNRIILLKKYKNKLKFKYYLQYLKFLLTRTIKFFSYLISKEREKSIQMIRGCIDGKKYIVQNKEDQ